MKKISNIYINNFLKKNSNKKKIKKLNKNFNRILGEINLNLNSIKNTYHVLSKKFNFDFKVKDLKKFNRFNTVVIIGMGGSILGSHAIYDFLKHKIKKKFIFFDNLDHEKLYKFRKENSINKCLFLVISKSGDTIETLANFITLKIIKLKAKNIIIITEKSDSLLLSIARKYKIKVIEHKKFLGGRYSVLSEVGIIPAYLMGLNIKKLRNDLEKYLKKNNNFLKNSVINLAQILNEKKFRNIVFLNYSSRLEKFLFWCQQLIAESLGKKGKGFLPVVSNAPKDHHSLLQLYFDGPKDKIFYIFSYENNVGDNIKINYLKKINYLYDKNINMIKEAQKKAAIKVLIKNKIPFREFKIKKLDENTLGDLFSYFILETSIVGRMININPFDQPAVEQVKVFTKKVLS